MLQELKNSIIEGDEHLAVDLANKIIEKGIDVQEAIIKGISEGMKEVGKLYEQHEYFIPEIIISVDALNAAFEVFKPHLDKIEREYKATAVVGVVKGDIHEIGKSIVATFLSVSGYKTIDLGRNVHSDEFIKAVIENNAEIVCLSTLMTPTLEEMGIIINKLKEKNLRSQVKVIIGGAPTSPEFMKEIGADYYCKDANDAIEILDKIYIK